MCVDGTTGVIICVSVLARDGNPPTTCHTCFAVKEEPHYVTISCTDCFEVMCDTSQYIGFGHGSMDYQHGCYRCIPEMLNAIEYTTKDANEEELSWMEMIAGMGINACARSQKMNKIRKLDIELTEPVTYRVNRPGDRGMYVFTVTPKRFAKSAKGAI